MEAIAQAKVIKVLRRISKVKARKRQEKARFLGKSMCSNRLSIEIITSWRCCILQSAVGSPQHHCCNSVIKTTSLVVTLTVL